MTTHTEKLIQDGLWRDIADAPRDESIELLIKSDVEGWESIEVGTWQEKFKVFSPELKLYEPTHFHPLPDDRLANALKVAVGALNWIVGYDGNQYTTRKAQEALTEINSIAKGEE